MEELPLSCTRIVSSRWQVECCKFSPSGDILSACFSDGSVRLYCISVCGDSIKAELKHHFKEHQSNAWCIAFSSDGLYLCSCSSDHNVIIYSLPTLSVAQVLKYHSDTVWCCTFSTHSMLATGSNDCTVTICNQETGSLIHTLTKFQSAVINLSFNSDGDKLATASNDGNIIVWLNFHDQTTYPTGLLVHSNTSRVCRFIDFNDNDYVMCSSPYDHCVSILDIKEGISSTRLQAVSTGDFINDVVTQVKCIQQFNGHCNIVWSVCCLGKEPLIKVLVTCSGDRTIRFALYLLCLFVDSHCISVNLSLLIGTGTYKLVSVFKL